MTTFRPEAHGFAFANSFELEDVELEKLLTTNSGGMFLSERARDAYFALQQSLVGASGVSSSSAQATLVPEAFELIRSKGSLLRTELARDIGNRRRLLTVED